ncbi:multidrug transporter [Vibrio tubiashii]|nr:multidrug transporter [Vibrio tubiashii]
MPNKSLLITKLMSIALPFSLQLLLYAMLGLVDIMMVSQLGDTAVAAVGLSNRIFYFNLVVVLGISGGVSVLAAQYWGSQDNAGIRRCLIQALIASLILSTPFLLMYTLAPDLLIGLASSDATLITLSSSYMQITGVSLLFTCIVVPIEATLRAVGDSKTPTYISVFTIGLNVFLNWLLIFGNLHFPELGVDGSAWGTTVARLFQAALICFFIWRRMKWLVPSAADLFSACTRKHVRLFATVAIPIVCHDGGWALGTLMYTFIYGQMSVEALAIMSILSPIENCIYSFFLGFSLACSTLLGHELGANRYEHARYQSNLFLLLGTLIALLAGMLLYLATPYILPLFGKLSASSVQSATYVLLVLSTVLCVKVFNTIGVIGILRSGGDTRYAATINICCMWGVGIPLVYISALWWQWPLYLVFLISMSEEVVKAGFLIYRLLLRKWLNNLVSDPVPTKQH